MAKQDQIKWDKKYSESETLLNRTEPSGKFLELFSKFSKGNALDIACGNGRHSIYLAKSGYTIDAFDISEVAIDKLNQKNLENINAQQIDLEDFIPKSQNYDLIIKVNYLDRKLIPTLASSLKTNGVLFIETYMSHPSNEKKNSNLDFLLQNGELKNYFQQGFEIVDYGEFNNDSYEKYRMKKQFILVKKL